MSSLVAICFTATAGFMTEVRGMVFYMIGLSYLSPIRFGYQAMIEIQFDSNQVQGYLKECTFFPKGCFEE